MLTCKLSRKAPLVKIAGFLLPVLLLAGRAAAVQHPVTLDPKADPSTCVSCHEDKTKGKSVHSAIAMGCTSCHEVRTNKDVTRVKLITTTTYSLCLTAMPTRTLPRSKDTFTVRRCATASSATIRMSPTIRISC